MAEKLQETRKFDFRDFTLCTSMGALCYLIAITLGSGSFHDMMSCIPQVACRLR